VQSKRDAAIYISVPRLVMVSGHDKASFVKNASPFIAWAAGDMLWAGIDEFIRGSRLRFEATLSHGPYAPSISEAIDEGILSKRLMISDNRAR
jgi:hypothetical protein